MGIKLPVLKVTLKKVNHSLKKLTKFYSSKLGKKSLMYMPRLSQATMIYAQKRIALHAKEIKDAIAKEARKLEKESEASQ
jgi:hypothetical protein